MIDPEVWERMLWHRKTFMQMTQAAYAAEIGVNAGTYALWEGGLRRLTLSGAVAIATRWGLSLDFILLGREEALPINVLKAWLSRPKERE